MLLFFLIASYFLVNAFTADDQKPRLKGLGRAVEPEVPEKKADPMEAINAMGSFNQLWLDRFPRFQAYYRQMLVEIDSKLTPAGLFFIKEVLTVICIAVIFVLELRGSMLLFPFVLAYLVPDMVLKQKRKEREFLIMRTFPEIIDLMGLCLSAGLDFMASLRWLTEGRFLFDNPLIGELKKVKEEISLGKSRTDALKDLRDRANITEVSSLVRTLVIAENMGVSVTESFERFSIDVRASRFHRGERQARMSAIFILFPLIFLIMPVVGIIIMGPIILKFSQGGFMGAGMMGGG